MEKFARMELLGCHLDTVSLDEAASICINWMTNHDTQHQVVTINAHTIVLNDTDADVRHTIDEASLVLADGISVSIAGCLLHQKCIQRVVGVDLTKRLLELGSDKRIRVFFLGATDQVLGELLKVCERDHPNLVIAGFRNGYFSKTAESEIVDEIRRCHPDLLLVGMPTPFKEVWINRNLKRLGVPVSIGVGGTFDVLSGVVPRAPLLMRWCGFEWLWRLLMEPRKMWARNRHHSIEFLKMLWRKFHAKHFNGSAKTFGIIVVSVPNCISAFVEIALAI